jgi:uncharacterized membrane protein YqjE
MDIERDRSFSELLQDIVTNVEQIVRSEVLLAKTEVREEARRAAKAGRTLAAAALIGFYAFGFLLICCMYALAIAIPIWAAALAVGGVLAIIAALMLKYGIRKFKEVRAPEQTIQSVKENVQWAKGQAK